MNTSIVKSTFRKPLASTALAGFLALLIPGIASAHVIVTPKQAGIGDELTFNVSVPDERTTPVTQIKLLVPTGVTEVTPTEKPGWTIQLTGSGDNVTAITWSGNMPVGERDDFSFSAQVPATATTLDWKAYQTYGDGTVVHWDQTPQGDDDDATGNAGPYSTTMVVNDLTASSSNSGSGSQDNLALGLAAAALIIAVAGFLRRR